MLLLGWTAAVRQGLFVGEGDAGRSVLRMDAEEFMEAVLSLVETVPPGRVTTYGGSPTP